MLTIPQPSILGGLRTTSILPQRGDAPHPALALFHQNNPPYRPKDHASVLGLYHPVVAALAPPFCAGRVIRLPLAIWMQGGIDVLVGAAALGCALTCLLMNQRILAGAYAREHSVNLMQLGVVVVGSAALVLGYAWFCFLTA